MQHGFVSRMSVIEWYPWKTVVIRSELLRKTLGGQSFWETIYCWFCSIHIGYPRPWTTVTRTEGYQGCKDGIQINGAQSGGSGGRTVPYIKWKTNVSGLRKHIVYIDIWMLIDLYFDLIWTLFRPYYLGLIWNLFGPYLPWIEIWTLFRPYLDLIWTLFWPCLDLIWILFGS